MHTLLADPSVALEPFVLRTAAAHPELGQFRIAALAREAGIAASPSGVRTVLRRHGLETLFKRMSAAGADGRGRRNPPGLSPRQLERFKRAGKRRELLQGWADADADGGARARTRRDHLLTVAARMFAERGYENATLKEIADAAGLLPGSVYHYFSSKEDLLAKVMHEGFRRLNAAVDEALKGCTDPWERLEKICAAHLEQPVLGNAIDVFTALSIMVRDARTLDPRLIKERDSYEQRFRKVVRQLPLPPHVDRSILRLAMLGALNWTNLWFRPSGKLTRAQIARRFVELVRR